MAVLEVGLFVLASGVKWCGVSGVLWWWLKLRRGNTEAGNISGLKATGGRAEHSTLYRTGHFVGFKVRLGRSGFFWWEGRGLAASGSFGWEPMGKCMSFCNSCGDPRRKSFSIFSNRVGKNYCTLGFSFEILSFKILKVEILHDVLHTLRVFKILSSPGTTYINYPGSPFWRAPHENNPGPD